MKVRVAVCKVYEVETEGGDMSDASSMRYHCLAALNMPITEIEKGVFVTEYVDADVEVVGPSASY